MSGTCGGGLGALLIHRAGTFGLVKSWSFLMTLNGALAGMVCTKCPFKLPNFKNLKYMVFKWQISVCAGSNVFYPWMALLTGVIGGFVFLVLHFVLLKIKG